MSQFWLSDGTTNTLDLGENVKNINLGGSDRNYKVEEFAYSNGGYIKGVGNYSPKEFTLSRDDFITNSDEQHAFNEQRNTFMKWFTRSNTTFICLNMSYSSNAIILRTTVYPTDLPDDEFDKEWNSNFGRKFKLVSPSGIWETTTTINVDTNITSSNEQQILISNIGVIECCPIFSFTPSTGCSVFQVKMADNYGFRLEGTFSSGIQISYYMNNGRLTINGANVNVTDYLTAGSPFNIPTNTTSIYITACEGIFNYDFALRFV